MLIGRTADGGHDHVVYSPWQGVHLLAYCGKELDATTARFVNEVRPIGESNTVDYPFPVCSVCYWDFYTGKVPA